MHDLIKRQYPTAPSLLDRPKLKPWWWRYLTTYRVPKMYQPLQLVDYATERKLDDPNVSDMEKLMIRSLIQMEQNYSRIEIDPLDLIVMACLAFGIGAGIGLVTCDLWFRYTPEWWAKLPATVMYAGSLMVCQIRTTILEVKERKRRHQCL